MVKEAQATESLVKELDRLLELAPSRTNLQIQLTTPNQS
jgi:hypothetical protein